MHRFLPSTLFDLSQFIHEHLFDKGMPVWEALKKMSDYLSKTKLGEIEGHVDPRAYLINPDKISIGKGTVVEAGAYIQGPCIIGNDCEVRSGAYIRGNLITGNKCVIGHATEVKNVLFLNEAKAGHFSYLGDSILGNRVNLGAGAKCANLRLDNSNVTIHIENQKINTGMRKLGAILADDVHLGCNSVANPGVVMGKKSSSHPCLSIRGYIPENYIVKSAEVEIISR